LVVVALLEVELSAVKFCRVDEPVARMLRDVRREARVADPPLSVVKKKLVVEELVAKKLVVVAEVPVAVVKVKFCRVVDAVTRRLVVVAPPLMVRPEPRVPPPIVEEAEDWKPERIPSEVREELTTLAAKVVPVSDPAGADPVMLPVRLPVRLPTPEVKKRLVVEAVVAKKLVVVALEEVEFRKVMFCRVDEAVTKRLVVVAPPLMVRPVPRVPPPIVEEAETERLAKLP
jgi:hypothetical protein